MPTQMGILCQVENTRESEYRTQSIAASWKISGEDLKYRKGERCVMLDANLGPSQA